MIIKINKLFFKLKIDTIYGFLNKNRIYEDKKENFFIKIFKNVNYVISRYILINFYKKIHFINEKYFFQTKTNFYNFNTYKISRKNIKLYKILYFLVKNNKIIIHLGCSTSTKNFFYKSIFLSKKFYQIDKSKKITIINKSINSSRNNIFSLNMDFKNIYIFLKKINYKNSDKILIYTNTTSMYLPKKEIEEFIIKMSKLKHVTLALFEPQSHNIDNNFFMFKNPIIFNHNYQKILKKNNFKIIKTLSDQQAIIAKNF